MNIQKKIGLRIKELRLKNKLSQEALANKANLDRTYMTSVENGKRNISINSIEKIVNALDVSFEEFFKRVNQKSFIKEHGKNKK
jgi:transcriptional regulator with XRE-family HTH domain